ncbi:MAG: hypothetical protein EA362_03175 [Saprospirales bacterium]|nr:MAG: hypothetical protein EA362_03175 [Saprospirales bacterium]
MKTTWLKLFIAFAFISLIASCVKEDFKDPPAEGTDPDIQTNATIADIKAFYQPGDYIQISEDLVFDAVVTADDRSGNFFRNLVIQDETGGIQIRFNFTDLHNDYPIGRRLFIRAQGMYISDFNGSLQLGAGVIRDAGGNPTEMEGVPLPLANRFIVKGKWNEDISPVAKRVNELTENDINTLIRLDNVQFRASDLGETFAVNTIDEDGNQIRLTTNRDLTSCTGDAPIVVRTSGFADFANTELPEGSGSVVGIYTVFGATKQLFIREIEDVQLTEERCEFEFTPISSIRGQFAGTTTNVSGAAVIRGIVTSDRENNNIVGQNLFIQDATAGIAVRFNGNHNFAMGTELEIDVSGVQLNQFQGLLQLNNVDLLNAQAISTGNEVEPIELTISNLLGNFDQYESRLVVINDVLLSKPDGGSTFAFSTTMNDGTGQIDMFTRPQANFADDPFPPGSVNVTGIVSVGGAQESRQISIRNLDDIDGEIPDITIAPISEIRDQYTGSITNISGTVGIRGVVTSDKDNNNVVGQNLFIQDENAGIVVRFSGNHNFDMGTELEINVSGVELSQFQGLLQLSNVSLQSAQVLSTGNEVQPIQLTIAEILNDFDQYESRLVFISDANITKADGGSTFAFSTTVNDGTGDIDMFTRPQATFADVNFPTETVSIVGILSVGGTQETRQISIRNLEDIDGDISGPETLLEEDFQMASAGEDISLPGWTNYAETGSRLWSIGEFSGNRFATMSSFESADTENKTWLITPQVEVENGVQLQFESAQGFHVHNGLRVYISNDYDGGNPAEASWTELNATIAGPTQDRWEFISSGIIDLSDHQGTAHVAFVYEGSNSAGNTSTFRIDNLRIFR